ncbi:MAG: homoserine O-acetyltransferase [Gemmatimonadetes bacterium]|nr:homoserine O-acetyltransferase [Gemmatimonadota bacterium]
MIAARTSGTSPSLHSDSLSLLRHELIGVAGAPVILALGGISATHHIASTDEDPGAGWWEQLVGAGRALDTTTRRVLSVCFADGGRARDGRPHSTVTTHDQATRIVDVLDALGIEQLDTVIGSSYGGMVSLALAEGWPERVGRLVVISAAHEPHPMAIGLRAVQRRIVELGLSTGTTADAMALARAVAMTTYRTAGEFSERFDTENIGSAELPAFDVERYLLGAGERFAATMAPERFLALSLSVDLHRVVPENVLVPTTVIAAHGDTLVPPAQLRAMARRLPDLRAFHLLQTRVGHDAFLTEHQQLGQLLSAILEH